MMQAISWKIIKIHIKKYYSLQKNTSDDMELETDTFKKLTIIRIHITKNPFTCFNVNILKVSGF